MSKLKTIANEASVSAFLEAVEDDGKREDCLELAALMQSVTKRKPRMWGTSIIGFGSYHYRYSSGRQGDWPITGFAPRKSNLAVYIMPGFSRYAALMEKLGSYKTGKSCLYLKRLDDVDRVILRQLIERSVSDMRKMYPCS